MNSKQIRNVDVLLIDDISFAGKKALRRVLSSLIPMRLTSK